MSRRSEVQDQENKGVDGGWYYHLQATHEKESMVLSGVACSPHQGLSSYSSTWFERSELWVKLPKVLKVEKSSPQHYLFQTTPVALTC